MPPASKTAKSKKVDCELPLTSATQGEQYLWTKGQGGSRRTLRKWTAGWTTAKSVAQEGRKVKPILPTTPSHSTDRTTSRTNLMGLKPAEDTFFFPFLLSPWIPSSFLFFFIPSSSHPLPFYAFFLPSFIYSYVLIFVKIPSYLASDLSLFPLPSFLSSFPISLFPPSHLCFVFVYVFLFVFFSFSFLSPPLSLFPTGETTKPGVLKRLELDCVEPINISSRPVSTGD